MSESVCMGLGCRPRVVASARSRYSMPSTACPCRYQKMPKSRCELERFHGCVLGMRFIAAKKQVPDRAPEVVDVPVEAMVLVLLIADDKIKVEDARGARGSPPHPLR